MHPRLTPVFAVAVAALLLAPRAMSAQSALDRALDDVDALLVRWAESGDEKRRAFAAREAVTLQSARWDEIAERLASDRSPEVRRAWFNTSLELSPHDPRLRDEAIQLLSSSDMRDAELLQYEQWPWAPIERDELEALLPDDDAYSAELVEMLCNGDAIGGSTAPVVARLAAATADSRAAEQLSNCVARLEALAALPPDTPAGRAELRRLWKSPEGDIDLGIAKQLADRRDPEFIHDFDSWLRRARDFTEPTRRKLEYSNLVLQLAPDLSPEAVREATLSAQENPPWQTVTSMMLWRRMGIRSNAELVRALEARKSPAEQLFVAGVILGDERVIDKGLTAGVNLPELRGIADDLVPFARALAPAVRARIGKSLLERVSSARFYGDGAKPLGLFCEGSCFDEAWLRFRAGGEEGRDRNAWLAVLFSSFDPRAIALRQQLSESGVREAAWLMKQGAPVYPITLDFVAKTEGPATFFSLLEISDVQGNVRVTGLRILFESELPKQSRELLRDAIAAELTPALVARAPRHGGEQDIFPAWQERDAVFDSRGIAYSTQWSSRIGSKHSTGLTRSGLHWLVESIPALPPEPRPVPLTEEMSADVEAWVASVRERDFVMVRGGMQEPMNGCGIYGPPRRGAELRYQGYEPLSLLDDAHLARLLVDADTEVRHHASALAWVELHDPRGPERLMRDSDSPDGAVRASALQHLAAIGWKPAASAFESALGSDDPRLRAAGIAGVERLPVEELFGPASLLVLDPDPGVAELAAASLAATRSPGFWRILVERGGSDFPPFASDPLMPEVLDSLESNLVRGLTTGELVYLAQLVGQASCWDELVPPGLTPREQIAFVRRASGFNDHDLLQRAEIDEAFDRYDGSNRPAEIYTLDRLLGRSDAGGPSHASMVRWWNSVRGRTLSSIWSEEVIRDLGDASTSDSVTIPAERLLDEPRCEVASTLVAMLWRAQQRQLPPIHEALVTLAGKDFGDPSRGPLAMRLESFERWQHWSEEVR